MTQEEFKSLLKPGAELKAFIIDPDDPEVKAAIKKCIEEQEKILATKNAEIDWNQRITI